MINSEMEVCGRLGKLALNSLMMKKIAVEETQGKKLVSHVTCVIMEMLLEFYSEFIFY